MNDSFLGLKEKVAEKVLGMKGNVDKAISGLIQLIDDKIVTLSTPDGTEVDITLDDTLSKYYTIQGTAVRDSKKDQFEKGDYVFAVGPEINGSVNANGIYSDVRYSIYSGKITEVDSEEFTVKVVTSDKNNLILDIQTFTTQEMLDIKTLELAKVGFSKLKEGDSIHVVVKANLANPKQTRFDAEKILIIPNEYFLQ